MFLLHGRKYLNGDIPDMERVRPTLPHWLSRACALENSSKESGWICEHMCNEGYLVN